MRRQLTRSKKDRWFAGVIGGIAEYLGLPSGFLRLLYILFPPTGSPVLLYIVLAIVIPEERRGKREYGDHQEDEGWSDF